LNALAVVEYEYYYLVVYSSIGTMKRKPSKPCDPTLQEYMRGIQMLMKIMYMLLGLLLVVADDYCVLVLRIITTV